MGRPEFDLQEAHQWFAVSCFNATWEYIDARERTPEEEEKMLHSTVAPAWHWSQRKDCTPQNLSIAYWQISRVHALCGRGSEAVRYGRLCLDVSREDGVDPFALAYAYEALARGEAVAGNKRSSDDWLAEASEAAEAIADEDTKKMVVDDLATIG